jgi:hypothetical protein
MEERELLRGPARDNQRVMEVKLLLELSIDRVVGIHRIIQN